MSNTVRVPPFFRKLPKNSVDPNLSLRIDVLGCTRPDDDGGVIKRKNDPKRYNNDEVVLTGERQEVC